MFVLLVKEGRTPVNTLELVVADKRSDTPVHLSLWREARGLFPLLKLWGD